MSNLIHFLLVLNRASGKLVSIDRFEEGDLATSAPVDILKNTHGTISQAGKSILNTPRF